MVRHSYHLSLPARALVALALLHQAPALRAAGFEFPANGTEALGRGGAFTARADSPLALEYNVAGFARQRGTRLLLDNNLIFSSYRFQRSDEAGSPMGPLSEDQSPMPFYAPWFGLSTDFGFFDRFTIAVGVFAPSAVGRRSYLPDRNDAPQRYDLVSSNTRVLTPTLAAAIRLSRLFDLGLSLGGSYGSYEIITTSTAAGGLLVLLGCTTSDNPQCDTRTRVSGTSPFNPVLALGLLFHTPLPGGELAAGLNLRSAPNLGVSPMTARGTLSASIVKPSRLPMLMLKETQAEFTADLPWVIRSGLRYAYRKGAQEVLDVELDAVFELWSAAQGEGNLVTADSPADANKRLRILSPHHYQDTFSLRLGAAYNQPVGPVLATVRLGMFYDASATSEEYTRVDFDTLAKVAGTLGLGLRLRGVTFNMAYAYLHSLGRTVTRGQLRPINSLEGEELTIGGRPVPAVNNGRYEGHNHILSLGLSVLFEELVRGDRWRRGAALPPP